MELVRVEDTFGALETEEALPDKKGKKGKKKKKNQNVHTSQGEVGIAEPSQDVCNMEIPETTPRRIQGCLLIGNGQVTPTVLVGKDCPGTRESLQCE